MLPLRLTAALAAWLRTRRIWRLPLGERLLRFTPALSSSPGHAPTHETRFLAEGKVAALAPTSAMICCAESTPRPGTSANRCTATLDVLRKILEQRDVLCSRTNTQMTSGVAKTQL